MNGLVLPLLLFLIGFGLAAHIASCAAVIWRYRRSPAVRPDARDPALTVLRPVCGLDPGLEETLATTYAPGGSAIEVIFCVADPCDPCVPVIRKLIAAHPATPSRLLIGEDPISSNPKLNNLVKGWRAASHEWIAMIDSNVLLPPGYVRDLFSAWREGTGLVTSPPVGIRPRGLWAMVECALLNGYQARWQLTADQFFSAFAQGKVLFWRRDILDAAGGPSALAGELAEDVAATKIVRRAGLAVRVVSSLFAQPMFTRRFAEVWQRHVRWARVRRAGFPALFWLEIFSGAFLPLTAAALLVALGGASIIVIPALLGVWYGLEWAAGIRAGWPDSAIRIPVWIVRDALIPAIWLAAFGSRSFVWRGTQIGPQDESLLPAE